VLPEYEPPFEEQGLGHMPHRVVDATGSELGLAGLTQHFGGVNCPIRLVEQKPGRLFHAAIAS
jgi:hypothetical protein